MIDYLCRSFKYRAAGNCRVVYEHRPGIHLVQREPWCMHDANIFDVAVLTMADAALPRGGLDTVTSAISATSVAALSNTRRICAPNQIIRLIFAWRAEPTL